MRPSHPLILLACLALTACDDGGAGGGSAAYDGGSYAPPPGGDLPANEAPQPPSAQDGENYEDYGANPFVDAAEDNLVTFGVDVDTASYTLMRRDLNGGVLPVPAGVRVEEYINFFDHHLAEPAADDAAPFAVHLEAAPSRFGAGLHLLRVALKGYTLADEDRAPANVVFLVDVSGSMQAPNKIGLVRHALTRLTQTMRPDDTIGIVVYAGADGVLLPPTPVAQRGVILSAIEGLSSGGGTNGEAGIRAAYDLAEGAYREGGINRVVLCSDGDFNVGLTGDALLSVIERFRDRGITLSVFGFGNGNYNDRDMEQLADRGNGNYAYVDSQREVERAMVEGVSGTLQVIAKDVKVQVELNRDLIVRHRLIGYENRDIADDDFRDDAVDAGEIGAGHSVTAYIEVELAEGALAEAGDLATVRLRYKAPDAAPNDDESARELTRALPVAAIAPRFDDTSDPFRFGAAVAEYAEILRHSPHSEGAEFAAIREIAAAAAHPAEPDQAEFVELVGIAERLWR
ncbi:MAG: von Willebrand factor type A domain-containing protein [Myxococcales bacterium]|nr:von Willebrand factor type A domain-containing protein [Myxococcales bacterium]